MLPMEIPDSPEATYTAPETPTSTNFVKVIQKFYKLKFNEDKDLIKRRLTKPKEHVMRNRANENVDAEFKKAPTRCVLCCEKCNHKDGVVVARANYHRPLGAKMRECPPAWGRHGRKVSTCCETCGMVTLCVKPRTANGLSCWDIWHTQRDLFEGNGATLCDVANPGAEMGCVTRPIVDNGKQDRITNRGGSGIAKRSRSDGIGQVSMSRRRVSNRISSSHRRNDATHIATQAIGPT